jgi:hypothetical protein
VQRVALHREVEGVAGDFARGFQPGGERELPGLARERVELAAGRDVAIAGFGKFSVGERAAREGRNPATRETIQIAASRAAKFSAAAGLKQQLNG